MREIRLYGSEGGGAARSPYPYQGPVGTCWIPAFAGMTRYLAFSCEGMQLSTDEVARYVLAPVMGSFGG